MKLRNDRCRLVLIAIGLALGLIAVPTARVVACSCAFTEMPQAIRDADVAIVGTLTGTDRAIPALGEPTMDEIAWTWNVERSRDPMSAGQVSLAARPDSGANCGVAFGIDERWLVLGYLDGGRLETNGCMRNHRMDGSDPDTEAIIDSMLTGTVTPAGSPVTASGPSIPMPLLAALVGAVLVAVASAWAFRRAR